MGDTIFNDDVLYMKSLVGKVVSIQTVDNCSHEGVVYVIDPVYKTVVLTNPQSKSSMELILYHAITSFKVVSETVNEHFLHTVNNSVCTEETLEKKCRLMNWLKHLFLDVKEDGELLRVDNHLMIGPPYGKEDCMCDNTIVLEKIRNIIDLMPANFQ